MHFNELPLAKHKISRPLKNCPLSIPISGTTFGLENTKKKLLIVDSIVVLKTSKSHVTPIKKCTNVFFRHHRRRVSVGGVPFYGNRKFKNCSSWISTCFRVQQRVVLLLNAFITHRLSHFPKLRLKDARASSLEIETFFDDKLIFNPPLHIDHHRVGIHDPVQHGKTVKHNFFIGGRQSIFGITCHIVGFQMNFSQFDRN